MKHNLNTKNTIHILRLLPTKLMAIGFIVLILLGNYWLIFIYSFQSTPKWLWDVFILCSIWIIGCGFGIIIMVLVTILNTKFIRHNNTWNPPQ